MISQKANLQLTHHYGIDDAYRLVYTYQIPDGYFDFMEVDLITNGSQLFISDLYIYSQGRNLSESILILAEQPRKSAL